MSDPVASRFREQKATPPGQAIIERRLEALRKLLASSSLPIATACRRCGFGSENNPKKLFRQRYGMTMREFRGGMAHALTGEVFGCYPLAL